MINVYKCFNHIYARRVSNPLENNTNARIFSANSRVFCFWVNPEAKDSYLPLSLSLSLALQYSFFSGFPLSPFFPSHIFTFFAIGLTENNGIVDCIFFSIYASGKMELEVSWFRLRNLNKISNM